MSTSLISQQTDINAPASKQSIDPKNLVDAGDNEQKLRYLNTIILFRIVFQ